MWFLQLIVMKLDIKMKGNNWTEKNHFGDYTGTATNLSDFKVVRGNRVSICRGKTTYAFILLRM